MTHDHRENNLVHLRRTVLFIFFAVVFFSSAALFLTYVRVDRLGKAMRARARTRGRREDR